MRFQIMSDSHMQVDHGFGREYGGFEFPAAAPNLVLLGGMGRVCDQELSDFIVVQLARFERVFYVMGRDEFYGGTYDESRQTMDTFTEQLAEHPPTETTDGTPITKLGEFHYLHRKRVDIGDITVLGCTLWLGRTEQSPEARTRAHGFRPIKDFFAEEELNERECDLVWLETQLDACANGEAPPDNMIEGTSKQAPAATGPLEEEEGDIYNDVDMSLAPQIAEPSRQQTTAKATQVETATPSKRQGPPRRIIVFTSHPPTHKRTTHRFWQPDQVNDHLVETLLQDRQCWVPDDETGNGVFVDSPVHGSDVRRSGKSIIVESTDETGQENIDHMDVDTTSAEVSTCRHDSGDPSRPPGIAAWAFGVTRWSCDVQYDAGVTLAPEVKGKRKADEPLPKLRCPSCKRVPAPIRMVCNQRDQQWKRNPVVYVDVPIGWRAFDDALVIDV